MAWVKVPAEHHPLFRAALPKDPRIQTLQMFGGVAGKVNGKMFGGLFGRSVIVRLQGADHAEALALDGAEPFDPMGRGPSKDMVMLPEDMMHDEELLRSWLVRAIRSTAEMVSAPAEKKPAAKTPAMKTSSKKPAAKKPATKTSSKKPAAKKPATKTSSKKPAAKKPAAKKPAAKKPTSRR